MDLQLYRQPGLASKKIRGQSKERKRLSAIYKKSSEFNRRWFIVRGIRISVSNR